MELLEDERRRAEDRKEEKEKRTEGGDGTESEVSETV